MSDSNWWSEAGSICAHVCQYTSVEGGAGVSLGCQKAALDGQATQDQATHDLVTEEGGGWSESDLDAIVGSALDRGVRYDDIHTAVTMSAQRVALQRAGGNQKRAAELLGLNRNTLRKKVRDLELQVFRTGRS